MTTQKMIPLTSPVYPLIGIGYEPEKPGFQSKELIRVCKRLDIKTNYKAGKTFNCVIITCNTLSVYHGTSTNPAFLLIKPHICRSSAFFPWNLLCSCSTTPSLQGNVAVGLSRLLQVHAYCYFCCVVAVCFFMRGN